MLLRFTLPRPAQMVDREQTLHTTACSICNCKQLNGEAKGIHLLYLCHMWIGTVPRGSRGARAQASKTKNYQHLFLVFGAVASSMTTGRT